MIKEQAIEIKNMLVMVEQELCFGGNWEDAKATINRIKSTLDAGYHLHPEQAVNIIKGTEHTEEFQPEQADRESVLKFVSDNIAMYDCQGDCPDEIALAEKKGKNLRNAEYCDSCFTNRLLALLTPELKVLSDERIMKTLIDRYGAVQMSAGISKWTHDALVLISQATVNKNKGE